MRTIKVIITDGDGAEATGTISDATDPDGVPFWDGSQVIIDRLPRVLLEWQTMLAFAARVSAWVDAADDLDSAPVEREGEFNKHGDVVTGE